MSNEVNLVDLFESVCGTSSWHAAMECLTEALGEIPGVIGWVDKLIDAGEHRERTLAVLVDYAKEAGWQVTGNRAFNRVTSESELEALREENLRLKGNLEHYAKQLRDVPPPGTKERLAEALEKLQTEALRSAHLRRIIDTVQAQNALQLAQLQYEEARKKERDAEKALVDAFNREGKGGLESAVLAADQNPEE